MRVTVVGAGIMGLSTAWALARSGHDVTVCEQGAVPNPQGSSLDEHRLIRHPYGAQAGYMRMVSEAYRAWDELWADLGERLYAPTGTLVLDTTGEAWAQDSARALEAFGLPVEWLDRDALVRRFPLVAAPGVGRAFFLGTGGALLADRIVTALARHLEGRGARIRPRTRVAEVDQERARVVLADGLALDADALVVAAGTWAERLVPSLAARVRPSRQVVAYAEPPSETATAWAAAPMILDIAPEAGFYLVPPVAGTRLKIGDHRFRLDGDPDAPREASPSEAHAVFELCRHRLRDFDRYRLAGARVCFYTVEPRERFLVEPRGKTWVVSACSGHAFKFGPILGQAVAAAIDGRREAGQVSRWAAGEA